MPTREIVCQYIDHNRENPTHDLRLYDTPMPMLGDMYFRNPESLYFYMRFN